MSVRFAERIREAQETIEVLRKVHPANHPDATAIAEFFELHAAHEHKHGRTENAERAAQQAARLRANPSPAKREHPADAIHSGKAAPGSHRHEKCDQIRRPARHRDAFMVKEG